MSITAPQWEVAAGLAFSASLVDPAGGVVNLGARVETPVNRAVVSNWTAATLLGSLWTVTLVAPVASGAYELVWRTGDPEPPDFEAFVPLVVVDALVPGVAPVIDYPAIDQSLLRPTVDDVGRLESVRTVDEGGEELGTFTASTRPTADQVEDLIDQAADDVLSQLPRGSQDAFNPAHYPQVKRATARAAAVLVELSFYREQADDRAVQLWQQMVSTSIAAVSARIEQDLGQQNLVGGMEPRVGYSVDPALLR